MVFIEGSGVGMDRNSYEKLWEIVIQPEINTFIDDFSCDASVFQELRLRLRVAPDAKELIWSRYCYYNRKCKHRLTMVNTPLNKALGVRNQIFHSKETRSAVAWTWERMMSATCRRSSKSMLSQFPRWEDKYSIFCGETLSAFSAAISFISP